MKIFFRRIHLYLGLAAGLVILMSCLTGAILVFQKELEQTFLAKRYFVEPAGQKLALAHLQKTVQLRYPKAKINSVKVFDDPARTVEMNITLPGTGKNKMQEGRNGTESKKQDDGRKPAAEKGKGKQGKAPATIVFVHPYTGNILAVQNGREGFFPNVLALHRWLLGTKDGPGSYIVACSAFIFLFILITGIILWWPKTRNILRQRLKIKQDAGWKRMNHDLHLVLGFYSSIFLFVIAFTGTIMAFEWMNKGIYKVTSSPEKLPEPPHSIYLADTRIIPLDAALAAAKTHIPQAEFYNLNLPKDSTGAFNVVVLGKNPVHEFATDMIYVDQYSGKVLGQLPYQNRSLGARVRSTVRPLHTGSLWGVPSKIVALLIALMGATFPITGTIMWWNRTRKKPKKVIRDFGPVSNGIEFKVGRELKIRN